MDEEIVFSTCIQKLFLKKEQEYGKLKFISSRATEETSRFIEELLEAITKIAQQCNMYNIKLFHKDYSYNLCNSMSDLFHYYNSFLLNTDFSLQYHLAEDMTLGHLVNFWPSLSPYLFIQIIWRLKCEDLLVESLVHLPLDLSVEILDVVIRCINDLEIVRVKRFVFLLIYKLYYKCLWLSLATQSIPDMTEPAYRLVAHFQALLDLLISPKFLTPKSSVQERYVQHGIVLKQILRHIKMCMHNKTENYVTNCIVEQFKITYGNSNKGTDFLCKLPIDEIQSIIETLDQDLVNLLLNEIKKVDCYEFMAWAEVDDEENVVISLQRAIIVECHYFMKFMKRDEFLATNEHLLHCIQQFIGLKKSERPILTLQELCHSIDNGRTDSMRELLERYKEWDQSTLDFISKNTKLLNKSDFIVLLEYLHYMFAHPYTNEEMHEAYVSVLMVLIQQKVSVMYNVILQYVLRYFHDNCFTRLFREKQFKRFIENNINMRDHQKLRILLIFVMLNPKMVLTILVTIAMGSTKIEHQNIMFKKPHIYFLHAFLCMKLDDQHSVLTYILTNFCLNDKSTWCYKHFEGFLDDMLYFKTLTPDDLLNNVYIPYLSSDKYLDPMNLLSVLTHMYSVCTHRKRVCTHKTNYAQLIINLTRKLSTIRIGDTMISRSATNNLLKHGAMILNFLLAIPNLLTPDKKREVIKALSYDVEPIDLMRLAPLFQIMHGNALDVVQYYERRCLSIYNGMRTDLQCNQDMYKYARSFRLDRNALLRHLMLHATEEEYKDFVLEITTVFWSYFGWANELEAYQNILLLTGEVMQLTLKFTYVFTSDAFVSLLRALIHYCEVLSQVEHMRKNEEVIRRTLLKILFFLRSAVSVTHFNVIYDHLLACMNSMCSDPEFEGVHYFRRIKELIEMYFVRREKLVLLNQLENESLQSLENERLPLSPYTDSEKAEMLRAYQFVCSTVDETIFDDTEGMPY